MAVSGVFPMKQNNEQPKGGCGDSAKFERVYEKPLLTPLGDMAPGTQITGPNTDFSHDHPTRVH